MRLFERQCPVCGNTMNYVSEKSYRGDCSGNVVCQKCSKIKMESRVLEFFRKCPECGKELGYSVKRNRDDQERKHKTCRSCSQKGFARSPAGRERAKASSEHLRILFGNGRAPATGVVRSTEAKERMRA